MSTGDIPRKPTGQSSAAQFAKWAHRKLSRESALGIVAGHRVFNTTQGPMIVPSRSRGDGGSATVEMFKLRAVEDDYLVCRDWDGTTLGTSDVFVVKPAGLRCSLASETYYGATNVYTYAYDTDEPDNVFDATYGETAEDELRKLNKIRTATQEIGETVEDWETEDQQVVPVYFKGQVIHAIETDGTGVDDDNGSEITLLELKPNRQWAAIG